MQATKKAPKAFDEEAYKEALRDDLGYCEVCEDWTRDTTEPDAEGYDCPECGGDDTVIGADNYMVARI